MKILVASDSFKGSAGTIKVAEYLSRGISNICPDAEIIRLPMADGGEGTVHTLVEGTGGFYVTEEVKGPLGDPVRASYGVLYDRIAVIEMAQASGLTLVEEDRRNPFLATTYGTGELILSALERGYRDIFIGIGGSATNDGGVGMASALGYRFLDSQGFDIPQGGGGLGKLDEIDTSGRTELLDHANITVMCDVDNPLYGKDGAAYVYGPQKGADHQMVRVLDENLMHFSQVLKERMQLDLADMPGSGAAGGLGAGLMAFCKAQLKPGVELVMEMLGFERLLVDVDLVVTGEGRMDGQSLKGKVPLGVARAAKKQDKLVIAVAGGVGEGARDLYDEGIDLIIPIVDKPMTLKEAMEDAERLLVDTGERIAHIIEIGKKL